MITPPPLLAIDVGNSRIKYGWFAPESSPAGRVWPMCREFVATTLTTALPWDVLRGWADPLTCPVAVAGSNPGVVEQVATHWEATTGRRPWVVRNRSLLPVEVDVDFPEKVGLDRLLNAVAANELRPAAQPAIVINSGTATTVDYLSADGVFRGGTILPGLALSSQALHHYTALLPQLSLADLGPEVPAPLGRNTRDALRSGIYWGQVGAIRSIVKALKTTTKTAPWLVLTGGGARWLSSQFPEVQVVPSLGMHGLTLTAWQHGLGSDS
ncbi:MAG: type III pantothenate kinase [Planctomycetaceae bacterium]|nr:type III pantothenate kinase [Planctomycetaceae bacterium]